MGSELGGRSWLGSGQTWLGAVGALAILGQLLWLVGPLGGLVGLVVAALWYVAPAPYAIAVGHVVMLPLLGDPSPTTLVGIEAGFLALLAAPMVRDQDWLPMVAMFGLIGAGLAGLAWVGWTTWRPRWLVGLTLVGIVVIGLYLAHRYSVVLIEWEGGDPSP